MSVQTTGPLGDVIEALVRRTGMVTLRQRSAEVALSAAELAAEHGLASEVEIYARILCGDDGHAMSDALAARLAIGETYFFRHPEVFRAIEAEIFPAWYAAGVPVRAWSAACSFGCEPYSLAIVWQEFLAGREGAGPELSILGSDLNPGAIQQARSGVFGRWSVRNLAPDEIRRWFDVAGDRYELRSPFRRGVRFSVHNLLESAASLGLHEGSLDLILLRNVLIYFEGDTVRNILAGMLRLLKPGGWLVPGASECNTEFFNGFETVNFPGAIFFRRPLAEVSPAVFTALPRPRPLPVSRRTVRRAELAPRPTHQALLAMIVDGKSSEALREIATRLRENELESSWHFLAALAHESEGDAAVAEAAYRRCLYLDRGHSAAQANLALLLGASGRRDAAARIARMALRSLAGSSLEVETVRGLVPVEAIRGSLEAITKGQIE